MPGRPVFFGHEDSHVHVQWSYNIVAIQRCFWCSAVAISSSLAMSQVWVRTPIYLYFWVTTGLVRTLERATETNTANHRLVDRNKT